MKLVLSYLLFTLLFSLSLYAADEIKDEGTGTTFPSEISFSSGGKDYKLQATGVTTRKKFPFKLYGVASYLQDAKNIQGDKFKAILDPAKAKQLTLKWVRDVPADKIMEGYHKSFADNLSPQEVSQLKPQIDQYIGFFKGGVKEKDEQVIRWIPGGRIEVLINGQPVGNITNEAFATGVWKIWFGEKAVVSSAALLSLLK